MKINLVYIFALQFSNYFSCFQTAYQWALRKNRFHPAVVVFKNEVNAFTSTLWSILFETILDHVFLHVPKEYKANFLGLNIGPSMGYLNPTMIFE